jgi:hypothetical protein
MLRHPIELFVIQRFDRNGSQRQPFQGVRIEPCLEVLEILLPNRNEHAPSPKCGIIGDGLENVVDGQLNGGIGEPLSSCPAR